MHSSHLDHVCGFEDVRICGFTQDRSDVFDWTRQNHLTQNPKRSVNTGPDTDRSGTKEGKRTHKLIYPACTGNTHPNTRSVYVFRLLHVHRDVTATAGGRSSSAPLSALQRDGSAWADGDHQSTILCLVLLSHEWKTYR